MLQTSEKNYASVQVSISSFIPDCPYRRLGCLKYDSVLKRAVCQGKGNQYSAMRCCWLPSWVKPKDGFKVAVLRGGRLYV